MKKDIKTIKTKLIDEVSIITGINVEEIHSDVELNSLGIDSMSFVEILVFIEKEFSIKLMETTLTKEDFKTIEKLATSVHNHL